MQVRGATPEIDGLQLPRGGNALPSGMAAPNARDVAKEHAVHWWHDSSVRCDAYM